MLAENLKRLRRERGLTQMELAEMSGLSLATIQGTESGRHELRPASQRKIAAAFDVPIKELVFGSEPTRVYLKPGQTVPPGALAMLVKDVA